MKDLLLLSLKKFLESRFKPGKPLLLGYSGGPDSTALLHLLLQCRRFLPLELHLAHIDHGWREEGRGEADQIQGQAEALKLPLHLQRLTPKDFTPGNLEEQGRIQRLQFFSQVYKQLGCQALLLGHHADDQAEVVLKRVFEGASLFSLGGLVLEASIHGMALWRPLLSVTKADVLEWLSHRTFSFFQDPTNLSPQFLRGRMRGELLPALAAMFGKEVSSNLCRLGEESKEIKEYFSEVNRSILTQVQGERIDLNPFLPLPALQLKYLLKEWMKKVGVTVSRQILTGMVTALLGRGAQKKFGEFCVEKGVLSYKNSDKN
jgi:tRNA(Ile)-lysidine synthase